MRKILLIVFGLFLTANLSAQEWETEHGGLIPCGVERWAIKTCIDPDTVLVNFQNIIPSTIAYQRSLPVQPSLPAYNRLPLEDTVYSITCRLIKYKLETDNDIHLVICAINNHLDSMVAEIANPQCNGISSTSRYAQLTALRNWFDTTFHPTPSFQQSNLNIHITGVGFYDFLHGQTGIPPNGREIHPVLSMSIVTDVNIISSNVPAYYKLYQNYPNPFNPTTKIKFDIIAGKQDLVSVKLTLYDITGREVITLVNQNLKAGTYSTEFNGSSYPSGIYFYQLIVGGQQGQAGEFSETKKLLLIK